MIDRLRETFQNEWLRRGLLAIYVLSLSATIAIYIGISMLDVRTSTYFRGQTTLEKGRPNAVRGVVLNARTGQFRRGVEAKFYLRKPRQASPRAETGSQQKRAQDRRVVAEPLAVAQPGGEGIIHTQIEIPDEVEPGTYELVLRADNPAIDPFSVTTPVEVTPGSDRRETWLAATSRISDKEKRQRLADGPVVEQSGDLAIGILPPDGELPRGLPAKLHLVTYDAESGEPVAAKVIFEKIKGIGQWGHRAKLPSRVETDAMGLATIEFEPVGGQRWTLSADELRADEGEEVRSGEATLEIHTVASQMSLSLDRPYIGGRDRIGGEVHTLFRGGELLVDIYRGRDWLLAAGFPLEGRSAAFEFETSVVGPPEKWLYRLQISRDFYTAGDAWDIAHFVAMESVGKSSLRRALDRVAGLVAEHRDESPYFDYVTDQSLASKVTAGQTRLERWLTAYLEALPRHFSRAETLFNSQKSDRKELEEWKDRVQDDLLVVIIAALVGGFAVLAYVIVAGWRRKREHDRHLRQIDDELAAEADAGDGEAVEVDFAADFENDKGLEGRLPAVLLGVVAVATLVMFALGLILLLSYL